MASQSVREMENPLVLATGILKGPETATRKDLVTVIPTESAMVPARPRLSTDLFV